MYKINFWRTCAGTTANIGREVAYTRESHQAPGFLVGGGVSGTCKITSHSHTQVGGVLRLSMTTVVAEQLVTADTRAEREHSHLLDL